MAIPGDADDISSKSVDIRRNTRTRRNQEESMRRLSRPIVRQSTSPDSFSSEIKPRFWRCATAKSIEDLIRALRKKRKGKRIFKVEDYFFFKDQGMFLTQPQENSLLSETEPGFTVILENIKDLPSPAIVKRIYDTGELSSQDQTIIPNTVYERTIVEPSIHPKTDAYFSDVKIIKPFINKDVLRIMSYGAVSDRSSSRNSPSSRSLMTLEEKEKCSLIQQCMENANIIFKKIDDVIEENKKITEKKMSFSERTGNPYSQTRKFKNKNFSPLEALSKIEEINNIIDLKKAHRTDIVLPAKYLPGQQATDQQKEFIKSLQKKLEKLQQSYQHWTKWQEAYSVDRLSAPKRLRKKFRS